MNIGLFKKMLEKALLEEVLEELNKSNSELENRFQKRVSSLNTSFNMRRLEYDDGVLSLGDWRVEQARISQAVLRLLDDMEEDQAGKVKEEKKKDTSEFETLKSKLIELKWDLTLYVNQGRDANQAEIDAGLSILIGADRDVHDVVECRVKIAKLRLSYWELLKPLIHRVTNRFLTFSISSWGALIWQSLPSERRKRIPTEIPANEIHYESEPFLEPLDIGKLLSHFYALELLQRNGANLEILPKFEAFAREHVRNEIMGTAPPPQAPPPPTSDPISILRSKLGTLEYVTNIPLLKAGKSFWVTHKPDGVEVNNLGTQPFLPWEVFTAAIELMRSQGGRATAGNAMGHKLGDPKLPLDSIEGHVAHKIYGKQIGDSVFRRISVIRSLLIWAGICKWDGKFLELL